MAGPSIPTYRRFRCVEGRAVKIVDPTRTYMALDEDEWLPDVVLIVSISAGTAL
jgi:hypothetical protein